MVDIKANSLVLYKKGAARVKRVDEKLELELRDGKVKRVRPKDVIQLHPGPIARLADLQDQQGEAETAWELLAGSPTTLAELAELIFGAFSPETAWATWNLVDDGLLFDGIPERIQPRSPEGVEEEKCRRESLDRERASWSAFIARLRESRIAEDDGPRLEEVQRLATGRADQSRVLRALGRTETAENAHALLLELGFWSLEVNPHPQRLRVMLAAPEVAVGDFPDDKRMDLTHLEAFAIDDDGNCDPDDALSIEGNRLWVHVADAAALAPPDSDCDRAARDRSASLYLPEGTVPMLPAGAIEKLGLGLGELSSAVSIGIELDAEGAIRGVTVALSKIRVRRITYREAEQRLDTEPLHLMLHWCQLSRERRRNAGAVFIELPEVAVRYREDEVSITTLPVLESRKLVSESMLLAGAAIGRFGLENRISLPFATQEPPSEIWHEENGLAGMMQRRKSLKRSLIRSVQGAHAGLGLEAYVQATSPMRRYMDLVVHQQLRAYLTGRPGLNAQQLLERVGATGTQSDLIRKAERMSNLHWTLVYLSRNPAWKGEGVVVEIRDGRSTVLIPELGLETALYLSGNVALNDRLALKAKSVDLPNLESRFEVV